MFDVVTYALVKKLIGQAATGISKVEYKDGKLIFTLPDGSTIDTPLDISSGVAGASLNEEGALVLEFADGTSLTYAAASKENLQLVEEKVEHLEQNLNTLIDDNTTSPTKTWSSHKIIKALTIEETVEGTTSVSFKTIAKTPLDIETAVSKAPISIILTINSFSKKDTWTYTIPTVGTYNWTTGILTSPDGTKTQLNSHYIIALDDTTTVSANNIDSIKVRYKTISKQTGGSADYDMIDGGSAKEEA